MGYTRIKMIPSPPLLIMSFTQQRKILKKIEEKELEVLHIQMQLRFYLDFFFKKTVHES